MHGIIQKGLSLILLFLFTTIQPVLAEDEPFIFIRAKVNTILFSEKNKSLVIPQDQPVVIPYEITDIGNVNNNYPPHWWMYVEKRRKKAEQSGQSQITSEIKVNAAICLHKLSNNNELSNLAENNVYIGQVFPINLSTELPLEREITLKIEKNGKYVISLVTSLADKQPDCYNNPGRMNLLSAFAFEGKVAFVYPTNTYSENQRQKNAIRMMAISNLAPSATETELNREIARLQQKFFETQFQKNNESSTPIVTKK